MTTNMDSMLSDTVKRAIAAECTSDTVRSWEADSARVPEIFETFGKLGLLGLAVPEEVGGSGGELTDVAEVLHLSGAAALPLPYAEHVLLSAQWLAAAGRYDARAYEGVVTVIPNATAMTLTSDRGDRTLTGTARNVPWASHADRILIPCRDGEGYSLVLLDAPAFAIETGRNIAGEPRDTVTATGVPVTSADVISDVDPVAWSLLGALAKSIALAGATQRALELSVDYIKVREQFGRPIGKFQAVSHLLARTAEDTAAAQMAVESAVAALSLQLQRLSLVEALHACDLEIAAAKVVSSQSATTVSRMSHQMHGAMGVTAEYDLQLATRRLWSWREEFGSSGKWSAYIGRIAVTGGGANLWGLISR